jgi:hypothetical protein
MATNVVIIVSGGNVQACYADQPDVEIEMIDFDNIVDVGDGALREAEARAEDVERQMQLVY